MKLFNSKIMIGFRDHLQPINLLFLYQGAVHLIQMVLFGNCWITIKRGCRSMSGKDSKLMSKESNVKGTQKPSLPSR